MIDFKEIETGELWELFTRDFLSEFGFVIESPPDRGPDQGKDMIAIEDLGGRLGRYPFRWVVSCKHFSKRGKAVGVDDEQNIVERVRACRADGFIGFYSTLPSAGLNERLTRLRDAGDLRDYRIFDHKLIENYLIRVGYSELMLRYLPASYRRTRPLHAIADEFVPLTCDHCGRDLLEALTTERAYMAIIAFARADNPGNKSVEKVEEIYWACKSNCDDILEKRARAKRLSTGWEDIGDLAVPVFFLRWIFGHLNSLREGTVEYSDSAYDRLGDFIVAMSQKVMRENTEKEMQRLRDLADPS